MRRCKLHYKGVNSSCKHSEIIVQIKGRVNGSVSHSSAPLPQNQLIVLHRCTHKITFPHTNQVFPLQPVARNVWGAIDCVIQPSAARLLLLIL